MPIFRVILIYLCLLPVLAHAALKDQDVSRRADVQHFINDMVSKHGFDAGKLTALFKKVELKQTIIDAINRMDVNASMNPLLVNASRNLPANVDARRRRTPRWCARCWCARCCWVCLYGCP